MKCRVSNLKVKRKQSEDHLLTIKQMFRLQLNTIASTTFRYIRQHTHDILFMYKVPQNIYQETCGYD